MNILEIFRQNCQKQPLLAILTGSWLFFLCLTLLTPIVIVGIAAFWGKDVENVQVLLSGTFQEAADFRLFLLIQAWTQVLTWGLSGLLMMRFLQIPNETWTSEVWKVVVPGIFMILCGIPLIQFLTISPENLQLPHFLKEVEVWMKEKETMTNAILKQLLGQKDGVSLGLNLFVMALLPAVCEEVFFRGFIQRSLAKKYAPWVAILITAVIFSFAHFQFYGFFARIFLGAILGHLLYTTGSILPGIFAHFGFNTFMILATYYIKDSTSDAFLDENQSFPPIFIIGSLATVLLFGYTLYRYRFTHNDNHETL